MALVLGLLIAWGKTFYDSQNSEVTQLAADAVLLDKILDHYGPETKEIRDLLRNSVASTVDITWGRHSGGRAHFAGSAESEAIFTKIQELLPITTVNDSCSRRR